MAGDKRTGPEVTTPQARPDVESPPATTDIQTVAAAGDFAAVRNMLKPIAVATVARTKARRAMVLAHPDLAARLTGAPLRYERPEQWTGYVPPALLPEDACGPSCAWRCRGLHLAKVNDSPYRAALVAICGEAKQREQAAG